MLRIQNFRSRMLTLALLIGCLVCLALPARAASPDAGQQTDASYSCRVYHKASRASSPIGQLENGTKLTVLDQTRDFYYIDCYERNGYIPKMQVREDNGNYYVDCKTASPDVVEMDYVSMREALELRASVLTLSRSKLGRPYIYGSMGPSGFDCSGFTSYIFKFHNIPLMRCADDQMRDGLIVSRENLQIGDLLFFREPYCPWLASHVGIYAGNNTMIHSASGGVQYSNLDMAYYANSYVGARRVINVDTQNITQTATAATALSPMLRSSTGIRTAG